MTTEVSTGSAPLLVVEGLHAGYGHVPVLRGVDLHVSAGEIVTLVGANGAGKSTLLKTIVGLVHATRGRVVYDGQDATRTLPERAVRAGLALVPEGRMLFGPLTVEENLRLGAFARRGAPDPEDFERVFVLFPVLRERLGQTASTLSGGEQQMLAIGRALMSRPRLLLLDEPSLGLAPKVIAEIFGTLDRLRTDGLTVLLVEQDVKIALRHADRGYVMRTGAIAHSGSAKDLLADDHVRHIYLGAWDDTSASSNPPQARTGSVTP
ncbi:MAG: ABC transporter ATP-binding protein [Coriobacteriia bacterium]|nr:ABC transporter ATP-binding protein [Coriobacteriia bacterium]